MDHESGNRRVKLKKSKKKAKASKAQGETYTKHKLPQIHCKKPIATCKPDV
jgi:hypothetical protein